MNGDPSGTPTLLLEQARALVGMEESRFAASQTRATALLAVTGVLAGIGGTIFAGVKDTDYSPLVLLLAGALALASFAALLWTAFLAIGSLQRTPEFEPEPEGEAGQGGGRQRKREKAELADVSDELTSVLDLPPQEAAQALLPILAKQTRRIHGNTEDIHDSFNKATRGLAIAVFTGLVMSLLVVFGRAGEPQEVRLVEKANNQGPGLASARLSGHE